MQIVWFHLHVFKHWTISAASVGVLENNIWVFMVSMAMFGRCQPANIMVMGCA